MNARHSEEKHALHSKQLAERAAYSARRKAILDSRTVDPAGALVDFLSYSGETRRTSIGLDECRQYAMRAAVPLKRILERAKELQLPVVD